MQHTDIDEASVTAEKTRNPNIELLRILAMLMIVCSNDIADGNYFTEKNYAVDASLRFIKNFGGTSDALFFGITAWFLCMAKKPTLKGSFKRIWKLEWQLLFYAYPILLLFLILKIKGIEDHNRAGFIAMGIQTLFPTLSGLWWYPTSYAFFLILYPWINKGLRAIGQKTHGTLAIIMFAIWGLIPYFLLDMNISVWLFIFLYVLISYLRWYRNDLLQSKRLKINLFITALCIFILGTLIGAKWLPGTFNYTLLNNPRYFPALILALSLILWATQREVRESNALEIVTHKFINTAASGCFAGYLIIVHPWVNGFINWKFHFALELSPFHILIGQLLMPVIYLSIAIAIDLIRQFIFSFTVDKFQAPLFERGWAMIRYNRLAEKISLFIESAASSFETSGNSKP
ncbi:hypothetical protein KIM372_17610 [Bombiscardovia nodaiensis]|uniref:Symporter n=1 Tax=Bombiscardovia nodaiensis TaxID=2932181 RepID=A0ABM8BAA9_9BIFI|nr:hypothetical protein KIM372_17610 [Bombiscardovia nodaiensis]